MSRRREPTRAEDDTVCACIGMHDDGASFDQIAAHLDVSPDWAREVCTAVFMEERASEPLH